MTERMFRMTAVVPMAIEPRQGLADTDIVRSTGIADRARIAVARIDRADLDVREACQALLAAVTTLEQEVLRMSHALTLQARGIQLQPELITVGGDGLSLARSPGFPDGTPVWVHLDLPVREGVHLMQLPAVIETTEEGTELVFEDLTPERRDQLVAFAFQQQARELRRAHHHRPAR